MEVEDLLRKGAYGALMDEEDEGSKFCEEDIDQILQRRTHTITIQSEGKGSTFAKVWDLSPESVSEWEQKENTVLWPSPARLCFFNTQTVEIICLHVGFVWDRKYRLFRGFLSNESEAIERKPHSDQWELISSRQDRHFGLQFAPFTVCKDCSKTFEWSSGFPCRAPRDHCPRTEIPLNPPFLKLKQGFLLVPWEKMLV